MFRPSICAPPFRYFQPYFIADSIQCSRMVPRMGLEANYFRGGNSSTWSAGSISGIYAASTRNISGFNTLDTLSTPTISDVCTAGTACCTRGSVLLIILPALAVFGPSLLVLLILPVLAVFRTPHTRVQCS